MLSGFLEQAAQRRYQRLLSAEPPEATTEQIRWARTRLRSAAGPTARKVLTATLDWQGVAFSDKEWRIAAACRLWLPSRTATAICQSESGNGQTCVEPTDPYGDHATQRRIGPHIHHKHSNASDQLRNDI